MAAVATQLAFLAYLEPSNLPRSMSPDSWLLALAEPAAATSLMVGAFIALALAIALQTIFGRSLGKLILQLRVIHRETGETPSTRRFIIRSLLGIPAFLLFGAGYAWMLVDRRGRTWHDLLTDTVVVYTPKR